MKVRVFQDLKEKKRRGRKCPWSVEWRENGRRRSKAVGAKADAGTFATALASRLKTAALAPILSEPANKRSPYVAFYSYPPVPRAFGGPRFVSRDIPEAPGVYFIWARDKRRCLYVGQAVNLRNRLRRPHPQTGPGRLFSWVEFEADQLDFAECYYIGVLRPVNNFADRRDRRREKKVSSEVKEGKP